MFYSLPVLIRCRINRISSNVQYVPFYFCLRSTLLYLLHRRNPPDTRNIRSIAIPSLGGGLGGLDWAANPENVDDDRRYGGRSRILERTDRRLQLVG